jgi:hypothetical protein
MSLLKRSLQAIWLAIDVGQSMFSFSAMRSRELNNGSFASADRPVARGDMSVATALGGGGGGEHRIDLVHGIAS